MSDQRVLTFGAPEPGIHYVERPGAYGVLRDAQGRVAVCVEAPGLYLPGGGIDAGESPEAALAREVGEELALACAVGAWIGRAAQYCLSATEGGFLKIGHFYEGSLGAPTGGAAEMPLRWLSAHEAIRSVKDDFQRWAITQVT